MGTQKEPSQWDSSFVHPKHMIEDIYSIMLKIFVYINFLVNELYSLFLKFSAFGLLQDIRNNFHS